MGRKLIVLALAAGIAAYLLWRTFGGVGWGDLSARIINMPTGTILRAAGFAGLSYLCLTGFDYLGLRYAGRPLPYRRAALASFTALSIGHMIGFAALSSGAVRYRFYSRWGLTGEEVAKVILFCGVTVALGLLALGSVALLLHPALSAEITGLSHPEIMVLGLLGVSICVGYLLAAVFIRRPLKLRSWQFAFPTLRLATLQLLIGSSIFSRSLPVYIKRSAR